MTSRYPVRRVRFEHGRTLHDARLLTSDRYGPMEAACGKTGLPARGTPGQRPTGCVGCGKALTTGPDDAWRGLTIRQLWAFAIAEGFKAVENRTRRTHYRGRLLIHTSQGADMDTPIVRYSRDAARRLGDLGGRGNMWDARAYIPSRLVAPPPTTLALSAVIATARLVGCHQGTGDCCGPWGEPGQWHWELTDVQPLRAAVPASGKLGLWKPDNELIRAVNAASLVNPLEKK